GENVPKNFSEAAKWFERSANNGHPIAQRLIGIMYLNGVGVPQNVKNGAMWIKSSAEQNDIEAQLILGILYHDGIGVDIDLSQSFTWIEKASDQGNPEAIYILGNMYANGIGVEKNEEMANLLYKESAEKGFDQAQITIGLSYLPFDAEEAIKWLRKAAEQNSPEGQFILGTLYTDVSDFPYHDFEKGFGWIYQSYLQKFPRAIEWIERAKSGPAEDQYNIAIVFEKGIVIPKDDMKAAEWF
ncbi:TPR repeat protein, partial [Candidatus Thiomargarita nelsonii]